MNRKSILQIVLLVVLLAVGAGAYLARQDGGLEFIGALIGGETPAPVEAASSAPAPARPVPAPLPESQGPAIAVHPVEGEIQKAAFTVEAAEIENGVLTLRQGKEPLATEVKIFRRVAQINHIGITDDKMRRRS